MKKLAIIPPSDSPIPAVEGGAVETLTSYFLLENEKKPSFYIDVYCLENNKLSNVSFKYSNVIQLSRPFALKFRKVGYSILNKICKILKINKVFFYFDKYVAKHVQYDVAYDYILIENNMNVFECLCKYRNGREKLFFHLHNDILTSPYKNQRLCKLVYDNSEKVFCASDYLYDRFLGFIGNDTQNKIKLLNNCIDFSLFKHSSEEKIINLKNELGVSKDDFVVLYSGRITPEKGVLELIQGISMIKNSNIKCIIIGDCWFGTKSEKDYLSKIKDITKNDNRYIFLGKIDYTAIHFYYEIANLTVIPSKWQEPFGMVALESLSMGCPILITYRGGLKHIPDSRCGFIIDESKGLAQGICNSLIDIIANYTLNCVALRYYAVERAHCNFYGTEKYFELFVKEVF